MRRSPLTYVFVLALTGCAAEDDPMVMHVPPALSPLVTRAELRGEVSVTLEGGGPTERKTFAVDSDEIKLSFELEPAQYVATIRYWTQRTHRLEIYEESATFQITKGRTTTARPQGGNFTGDCDGDRLNNFHELMLGSDPERALPQATGNLQGSDALHAHHYGALSTGHLVFVEGEASRFQIMGPSGAITGQFTCTGGDWSQAQLSSTFALQYTYPDNAWRAVALSPTATSCNVLWTTTSSPTGSLSFVTDSGKVWLVDYGSNNVTYLAVAGANATPTAKTFSGGAPCDSGASVRGERLYYATGGVEDPCGGTESIQAVDLDPASSSLVPAWTYSGGLSAPASHVLTTTDAAGNLYLVGPQQALSLDAAGGLRWQTTLPVTPDTSATPIRPAVVGDRLIVLARNADTADSGTPARLLGLDTATGAVAWSHALTGSSSQVSGWAVRPLGSTRAVVFGPPPDVFPAGTTTFDVTNSAIMLFEASDGSAVELFAGGTVQDPAELVVAGSNVYLPRGGPANPKEVSILPDFGTPGTPVSGCVAGPSGEDGLD